MQTFSYHQCKWLLATMELQPLFDHNAQHIVAALGQQGPMRFSLLLRWTGLDNKTVARKLRELDDRMVVFARTLPSRGERVFLEYGLTPRGEAFYAVLQGMRRDVVERGGVLGSGAVQEAHEIFAQHGVPA